MDPSSGLCMYVQVLHVTSEDPVSEDGRAPWTKDSWSACPRMDGFLGPVIQPNAFVHAFAMMKCLCHFRTISVKWGRPYILLLVNLKCS